MLILIAAACAATGLLTGCGWLRSGAAGAAPPGRPIQVTGRAHPDETQGAPAPASPLALMLEDQALRSWAGQDLTVQFRYERERIPSMPELEELQTLAAARVRCWHLMADRIYRLPLERRRMLGPEALDAAPELKLRLERLIQEQGKLEALWSADRSSVEGRFVLPGQAVVETIRRFAHDQVEAGAAAETAVSFQDVSAQQRRRLAHERAVERARQALRERLLAEPVRSNQTVGDLVKRQPHLQARLDDFVRSTPLKSEQDEPDGSVSVVLEADARRLLDLLR
ncbi:MAG: hypothetical protein Kow0059_06110 [Candidatus Sumerlaeia bacterium]